MTDEAAEEPPRRFAQVWQNAGFQSDRNWTFAHGETRRF
jgi:hypothetical protein